MDTFGSFELVAQLVLGILQMMKAAETHRVRHNNSSPQSLVFSHHLSCMTFPATRMVNGLVLIYN